MELNLFLSRWWTSNFLVAPHNWQWPSRLSMCVRTNRKSGSTRVSPPVQAQLLGPRIDGRGFPFSDNDIRFLTSGSFAMLLAPVINWDLKNLNSSLRVLPLLA